MLKQDEGKCDLYRPIRGPPSFVNKVYKKKEWQISSLRGHQLHSAPSLYEPVKEFFKRQLKLGHTGIYKVHPSFRREM